MWGGCSRSGRLWWGGVVKSQTGKDRGWERVGWDSYGGDEIGWGGGS